MTHRTRALLLATAGVTALAFSLACGGGGSTVSATPNPTPTGTKGSVAFMATDATTESWSNVGVIIRKASLVLASDTAAASPVMIYDGSTDTTPVNLLQEDQVNDLLSQATNVPAGTYDRIIVEVDGSPSTLSLVGPADPVTGVVPAAIDPSLITVKGASDPLNKTWKVLPTITLSSPVTVAPAQASAVAVDFDLAHPAFIVEHDVQTAAGAETLYVVNFGTKGVFRHKPAASLDQYYLRRHLGTVASVAADASSLTMTTEHGQTLAILADKGSNPTLFYNLDVKPAAAVPSATIPATLTAGLNVECTARYQTDGTLTAVRVWYTATANSLPSWTPEGHVTFVDRANNILRVLDNQGNPKPFVINAATKWYFHGDTTTDLSGGNGVSFLPQIERFFKVHLTVVDPTATPEVAATVDIQRGAFEGNITSATATSFTYNKTFGDLTTATHALGYASTFSCWDFTFPGMAAMGSDPFMAEANSGIILDTSGKTFMPYGVSSLTWAGGTTGWNASNAIFLPIQVSPYVQTIKTAFLSGAMTIQAREAAAVPVNVTLSATSQEQPIVTLFTRQAGSVVTVTPLDSTQWAANLTAGAKVRVYGVPDGSGNLKAYYVNIYN